MHHLQEIDLVKLPQYYDCALKPLLYSARGEASCPS